MTANWIALAFLTAANRFAVAFNWNCETGTHRPDVDGLRLFATGGRLRLGENVRRSQQQVQLQPAAGRVAGARDAEPGARLLRRRRGI